MKLSLSKMYDILRTNDNGYYDFSRFSHLNKAKNRKYHGYLYKLCKPLTEKQFEELKAFNNVSFGHGHCEYAPEIKFQVLFVYDNKLSTVKGV